MCGNAHLFHKIYRTVVTGNFNSPSQLKNSHRLIFAHRVKKLTSHFRKEHTVNIPHFLISLLLGNNISFDNLNDHLFVKSNTFIDVLIEVTPAQYFTTTQASFFTPQKETPWGDLEWIHLPNYFGAKLK